LIISTALFVAFVSVAGLLPAFTGTVTPLFLFANGLEELAATVDVVGACV
jgi:hypothetical protein